MLAAATLALAQPAGLSPQQFGAILAGWTAKVQVLHLHPEEAAALAHDLPAEWPVRQRDGTIHVPTAWLKHALLEIQHDPAHASTVIPRLEFALAARQRLLDSSGDPSTQEPARRHLNRVLARREFRAVHPPTVADTAAFHFWTWLNRLFRRVAGHVTPHPVVLQWLVWMVILLAMGMALRFVWNAARKAGSGPLPAELPPDRPSAVPWTAWLQRANAAAGEGAFREAIHLAYWTAISWLESQGAWTPDRTRTPREYLRLLPVQAAQRRTLHALTRRFEPVWYGGQPASATDFDAMLRELEELGCH